MRGALTRTAFALVLGACPTDATLIVQVRTDLTPQSSFERMVLSATANGVETTGERVAGRETRDPVCASPS